MGGCPSAHPNPDWPHSAPPFPVAGSGTRHDVPGTAGYQQFNAVAKKLERRLAQLGARRLVATGLGDDQHPLGYEGARGEWVRRLLQALKAHRSGQWAHVHLAGPGAGGVGPPKYAVALQEAAPGGPCCVRELCEGAWVLDAAEVRAAEIQSSIWNQQQDLD